MDPKDIVGMVRRRWKLMLACSILIMTMASFLLYRTKPNYTASSKVLVKTPDYALGAYETLPQMAELAAIESVRNVQTQTELLKSAEVLERAVKEAGAAAGQVISKTIEPIGDSDVIKVTIVASTQKAAMDVANKLPEVYLRISKESIISDARDSREFFEHQLEKSRRNLRDTEDKLRTFKEENSLSDLSAETSQKVASLVDLEKTYHLVKTDRDAIYSQLSNMEGQLTREEKEVLTNKVVTENPVINEMQMMLAKLEVERSRLRQSMSEKHPQVMEINAQIDKINDKLKSTTREIVQSNTYSINPFRASLMEKAATVRADKKALDAKVEYLGRAISQEKSGMSNLPGDETRLARLVRDRDLAEELYKILETKFQDFHVSEQTKKTPGRIVERAKSASMQAGRKRVANFAVIVIIALAFSVGVVFLMEYFDEAFYTGSDVEKALGLSVLAQIPRNTILEQQALHMLKKPNSPVAEAFRSLRNKLRYLISQKQVSSLVVTSSSIDEGKTVISLNLAIVLAQFGKRVLLIDGDMRRPKLHNYFGCENVGLTNVIVDEEDVTTLIVDTPVENLSFLPSGPLPLVESSPIIASELFESPRTKTTISMLKKLFDFVIIDAPPVLAVTDALSISSHVDGIIFVVVAGNTKQSAALKAKRELDALDTPIIGAVLNKTSTQQEYYSRYLYYYYENGHSKPKKKEERI